MAVNKEKIPPVQPSSSSSLGNERSKIRAIITRQDEDGIKRVKVTGSSISVRAEVDNVETFSGSSIIVSNNERQSPEVPTLEDEMRERLKGKSHEHLRDYPQLFKAVDRKDWNEVEHFISENRVALSASLREECVTLFHLMTNYDGDEPLRLMEKFLGMLGKSHEHLGDYSQLVKALDRKDWNEVEHFISENRDALSASLREDYVTLFHLMTDYDEDEPLRLMEKFLGMVPAGVLEKTDVVGSTPLTFAAALGNTKAAKILFKFNQNLPNISTEAGMYPIHHAAIRGHRETIEYLLSVTEGVEDPSPFAGEFGFKLLRSLIISNVLDVALSLLKRYPGLARDEYRHRELILQSLAEKPKVFASGCRFGYWKRLIYQLIPVQKEHLKSPRSEKNEFDVRGSVGGDMENPICGSSKKTSFGFLPKMTTTFGTLSQNIHFVFWNALMQLAPCIKGIHDTKLMHIQSVEIIRMMCDGVNWTFENALSTLKEPVLTAAKLGIYEIVNEVLDANSLSLCFVDEDGNNVHMLAVLHRQEKLFRMLSQKRGIKMGMESGTNKSNDNILHLAGRLVPSSEVPGAALQMQRELQWFKAVENCFNLPSSQEKRNNLKKTPEEVFMKQHEELVKEGENWMKSTAQSCSVVVSLIITVVFAAAFTVPGGNNSEGIPIFLQDFPFIVFITSDALALFSSTTSLLMFLGILTSRYAQEDFMESLPRKLMVGLITMFFSIAAMMVAFGATVYIVLSHPWKWVIIPVALLGCIPVILFASLQFPLLVEIFLSTYRPSLFQPLKTEI